ncbi:MULTISPECIES: daptide-type RiPP [Micrococcaceae]|jgi:hypothetical protein|uniref:daptide-type RiPP n=1 Tax=Kocuria TaxID=57493 RepID=UPI000AA4F07C|nr:MULTISPECIES: daptide-type RiPP [Kocuria]MCT1368512.1 hypothetical protein [Rothia sp. p3-SID1597]
MATAMPANELMLDIDDLESLEAPTFWDGFKVGAGIGTAAGAAYVGAAAAIAT